MAFHLRSVDLDSARDTATRALRTISFREEDEKFNIWLALLDMEMKFGSQDSLDLTLKSASAESKGKYAHLHVAEQFSKLGDSLVAEKFFALALKKYKYSKKVWSSYQHFRLRIGDVAGAHELLSRSMQSLSRHKHVEVILKFAQGLFDCDQADRARVVFEELLASYPRRADLWHQYVDKEMKLGHHNQSRDIFERMISMKSSTQNMKTVFKKYLAFEIKNGSVTQQETVKQKAREYVESMM